MPYPSLLAEGGVFTYATRDAINALISSQGILSQGNCWWVRPINGSDVSGDGKSPATAFQTLAAALAAATANQNDVVILCAESNTAASTTAYQTTNLVWNKDLVHLIGVNAGTFCSPRSRIAPSASAAAFATLFTCSANGCLFWGVEFFQGAGNTTLSAASTCVLVSGERNVFHNCAISGMGATGLDYAGSNSLTVTGSDNTFQHCYIGLDTVIRSTSTTEVILSGTPARTLFEDCHVATYTSLTTFRPVTVGTSVDRFVKFRNCEFSAAANIASAAAPASLLAITTMNGQVLLVNPAVYGISLIATGGNTYVKVVTAQAATTVQGIGASAAAS